MPKRYATPAALLLALAAFVPPASSANAAAAASDSVGVLVMAHGGTPEWDASVQEAVAPLRAQWPTEVAFGMADPATLQAGVSALEARGARRIVVVRLFLSDASFLQQTEYLLGLRPDPPAEFLLHAHGGGHGAAGGDAHAAHGAAPSDAHASHGGHGDPMGEDGHGAHGEVPAAAKAGDRKIPPPIRHGSQIVLSRGGLVEFPGTGAILLERAAALSTEPAKEAVVLLAHGAGDDAENAGILGRLQAFAASIRERKGFADARAFTLREDWPESRKAAEREIRGHIETQAGAGRRVLVVPFRLFGFGPYRDVLAGLEYESDGTGLLPHDAVAGWLLEQVRTTASGRSWRVATGS